MNRISLLRYNALAGYTRLPIHVDVIEEVAWFAHDDEQLLGVVFRDRTDDDYGAVVVARDRVGRFRAVEVTASLPGPIQAKDWLGHAFSAGRATQGADQPKPRVDFFLPVVPSNRLNQSFTSLVSDPRWSPAHGIIAAMMNYYDDPDGNFVEQFQTSGFDARIWELYLFAALVELGFALDRTCAVPDFSCRRGTTEVLVEGLTVNPTRDVDTIVAPPVPRTPGEVSEYLEGYAAIKYGSALFSKLRKEYWKKPNVSGRPFLLAVQDFHRPAAMVHTGTALRQYLYGVRAGVEGTRADGLPIINFKPIVEHRHGSKVIPSNFFSQDGSEYISAVVFNNSGTLSKFNRLGFLARFGSRLVRMTRTGFRFDPNPAAIVPERFSADVHGPGYAETWAEGMEVFHNPNAKHPLPPGVFGAEVSDHCFRDGKVKSYVPGGVPYGSHTIFTQ